MSDGAITPENGAPPNPSGNGSEAPEKTSAPTKEQLSEFDKGFGFGVNKARKELLKELGVDSPDVLKAALENYKQSEEAKKTAAERLAELHSENRTLKEELDSFRSRRAKEVETVLEELDEEDKTFFTGLNLAPDQLLEVVGKFRTAPKSNKTVAPVNPAANQQTPVNVVRVSPGLDPEYRKNPEAYRKKLLENMTHNNS